MVYLPLWKMMDFVSWNDYFQYPIGSMYAIYGNIYHQYTPNVSIYAIHGSYGYMESHKIPWFQSTKQSRIAHLVSSDLGSKNKAPHATQGLYRPSFHMIYIYQHLPTIQTKGCKRCMCLFFSHLNAHPMPAKCPFSASSASTVASAASSPESAAGAVSAASRAWASAVAGASSLEASKGSFSWACWAHSSCRTRWERLAHDLFHVPSVGIQWSMSWFQEQSSGWSPHTVPSLGKNRSCSHAKSTNYLWMELTWRQQTGSQLRHHHKWYLAQKAIWIVLEMEHGNTYHINVRSIFITIQKSEGKYEKIMEHMVSTVSFGSFP